METKVVSIVSVLLFAAVPAIAGTVQIPQTGQTTSYAVGDDGDLEWGATWPDPRFTDNLDGTVKDDLTGLVWTKDASMIATLNPEFDNDDVAGDGRVTWQHALDYVAGMNTGVYENYGYSDWRLSNVNELRSLIDCSRNDPALPSGHPFVNQVASSYWSSTSDAEYTNKAWIVQMLSGYVDYYSKSAEVTCYVWPVRAGQCGSGGDSVICLPKTGQTASYAAGDDGDLEVGVDWPSPRFTDNLDGTVKDELTGIEWTRNANLPGTYKTWQAALDYVAGMNSGMYPNYGHIDWRLPNVNELRSLSDVSQYNPALPLGHPFTGVRNDDYWSSTTYAGNTGYAVSVIMGDGYLYSWNKSYNDNYVWPVRAGQGGALIFYDGFESGGTAGWSSVVP